VNNSTLDKFERLVCSLMVNEGQHLALAKSSVRNEGYAVWVLYEGVKLGVEFVYGAPSYKTQFFLSSPITSRRYSFADLMRHDEINAWVLKNRLVLDDEERIEAEIRWVILFISWLSEKSVIGVKIFPER